MQQHCVKPHPASQHIKKNIFIQGIIHYLKPCALDQLLLNGWTYGNSATQTQPSSLSHYQTGIQYLNASLCISENCKGFTPTVELSSSYLDRKGAAFIGQPVPNIKQTQTSHEHTCMYGSNILYFYHISGYSMLNMSNWHLTVKWTSFHLPVEWYKAVQTYYFHCILY